MISEEEIHEAVDFLQTAAITAAQARANRIHLEEYRKVIKAQIMQEHLDLPLAGQEREAYANKRYAEHLEAMKRAIFLDEKARYLVAAAHAKIEAWRTQSATERAISL